MNKMGITIIGLGPGPASLITRQAWEWIQSLDEIYLRTNQHPAVGDLPQKLKKYSFDEYYQRGESFEEVYENIVTNVLRLGEQTRGVTYAVPGDPFVAEVTTPAIVKRAGQAGIPVHVLSGVSFIEPIISALGIDPFSGMVLMDALQLGKSHHPIFPPSLPVIIAQMYSIMVASEVKLTLMASYPDEFPVRLIHGAGTNQQVFEDLALYEIDRSQKIGLMTSLYLPPLSPDCSIESFQETVAHLRSPEGCPWDQEQTHSSLRPNLLEEAYEVLTALDSNDFNAMKEEFGDLLLQIVLHAQIASEEGEFTLSDVIRGINQKVIRRHPHVFGDWKVGDSAEVKKNWEKLKSEERRENGTTETKGILAGVPEALPALCQAQEIQDRAARVGFDWADVSPVIQKVEEELEEVKRSRTKSERENELGDLLFAVVNLARWNKVDAESALRAMNLRFKKRFRHIEKRSLEMGKEISSLTLQEMDIFWNEAKKME